MWFENRRIRRHISNCKLFGIHFRLENSQQFSHRQILCVCVCVRAKCKSNAIILMCKHHIKFDICCVHECVVLKFICHFSMIIPNFCFVFPDFPIRRLQLLCLWLLHAPMQSQPLWLQPLPSRTVHHLWLPLLRYHLLQQRAHKLYVTIVNFIIYRSNRIDVRVHSILSTHFHFRFI